ncbi:MAG: MFS transporter [Actinobacteria bacterium]|nr:MFS transporter [Actinomycetota bacterium]
MRGLLVDLTPLRTSPTYRHLWMGGALAGVGSQLTAVAVGLQVYELSGSTLAVGFVGLAAFVPLVALGLYGGSIVDAYDRRKVLIVTLSGLSAVGVTLAVLAWTGTARVGLLYALVAIQAGFFAVQAPARQAVIPRLLPPELLPAANALATLAMGISFAAGPMLGGVLVDQAGYGWAYGVEVVLLLGALTFIFTLPSLVPEGEVRRAGLRSVVEGLRFLRTRPTVGMTFFVDLSAMVLALPRVLFPAIATLMIGGGATTVGILVSGIAVGTLLGGIFSGRLGRINRQGLAIVAAVVAWGLFVAAFGVVVALAPGPGPGGQANWALWPATLFMVLAGAADTVSAVFRTTILQVATPDALRGRLQGVFTVVVAGGPQLGSLLLGSVAAATGEPTAAIIGGVVCAALVAVVSVRQKGLIAYDARDPGAETGLRPRRGVEPTLSQ